MAITLLDEAAHDALDHTGLTGVGGGAAAFAGARAYRTTDQTITHATATPVTLNAERFDTDGYHDTATNNDRMTIPTGKAGKYLIVGNVEWEPKTGGTGQRQLQLVLNGMTVLARTYIENSARVTQNLTTVYDLAEGDYITMEVRCNIGSGTMLVVAIANFSPELMLAKIG